MFVLRESAGLALFRSLTVPLLGDTSATQCKAKINAAAVGRRLLVSAGERQEMNRKCLQVALLRADSDFPCWNHTLKA